MNDAVKVLVFALLFFLLNSSTSLADPPSLTVKCNGCEHSTDATDAGETFHTEEGASIALSADCNYQVESYIWQKNGQLMKESGGQVRFDALQNADYLLTTVDSLGRTKSFTARIIVKTESTCTPKWDSNIIAIVNGNEIKNAQKITLADGDSFEIEVEIDDRDCDNYDISWRCNSDAVSFGNSHSSRTSVSINSRSPRNPTLTVTISDRNGGNAKTKSIGLAIIENTAPIINIAHDSPVYSYTPFNVYFGEATTGASGNEESDYFSHLEVFLTDASGNNVDRAYRDFDKKTAPQDMYLKLEPDAVGAYILYARVTDSHGQTTSLEPMSIVVQIGSTRLDKPEIRITSDINCIAGKECVIDASQTQTYGRTIVFKFRDHYSQRNLASSRGGICCCGLCRHIFNDSSRVDIIASYLDEDGDPGPKSKKMVSIYVTANASRNLNQTECEPREAPEDIKIAIAAICLFLLLRKKIRRMCGFF
jgi:hypothetical protein